MWPTLIRETAEHYHEGISSPRMGVRNGHSHPSLRPPGNVRPSRRIGIGLLTIVLLGAMITSPAAMGARARTFVVDCGNVSSLTMRPHAWSGGCTAGSGLVKSLHWIRYGPRRAVATGLAIVGESANAFAHTKARWYKARFVMSHPRACPDHSDWSYFYTERLTITYPGDNPWGKSPGKHTRTLHPIDTEGPCGLAPG